MARDEEGISSQMQAQMQKIDDFRVDHLEAIAGTPNA